MSAYTIKEIARIIGGKVSGQNYDAVIENIFIDSRKAYSPFNSLFFAISGKHHNGHDYIDSLQKNGYRFFVVSEAKYITKKNNKSTYIVVNNTLDALQKLSEFHRKRFKIPVIGITGSNGKTVVKEWLHQLLAPYKNVVRNPKSYNSQVGVPLSVWKINASHNAGIFEAGISQPGEMEKLQKIIHPDTGIILNIGKAHDEGFKNRMQKAEEKLKLFKNCKTIIYCKDYEEVETALKNKSYKKIQKISWSKADKKADCFLVSANIKNSVTEISLRYKNKTESFCINHTDNGSIENAVFCWLTINILGINTAEANQIFPTLGNIAMRLELKNGINNTILINDSYNSDVNSLAIALDFLHQQSKHNKKTVIISDIHQAGTDKNELYKTVANLLSQKKVNRVIGIGQDISALKKFYKGFVSFYADTDTFLQKFSSKTFKNECILIKGARYYRFEKISAALEEKQHETIFEINLNAIIHNLNYYRSLLKPKTKIMAMVKALSYGSGSYEIAKTLQFHRIDYMAVAYTDEGIELRKSGITTPIMVMSPQLGSADLLSKYNLEPEVYSLRGLDELINSGEKKINIHLKLDTGMHRLGFEEKEVDRLISTIAGSKNIYVKSIFSHLASSDNKLHTGKTIAQLKLFDKMSKKILAGIKTKGKNAFRHILNTSGIYRFPEYQFDMVRLGIGLYGIGNSAEEQANLVQAGTLKANILQIKKIKAGESVGYGFGAVSKKNRTIATISIGYADGLSRTLGNGKGKVWLNGKKVPIIGNICMDMCMIDISEIAAAEGDEVIIFGQQNPVNELAKQGNTIPYEIIAQLSSRIKRLYYQE